MVTCNPFRFFHEFSGKVLPELSMTMYRLIAFNEVSANFTAHFEVSISPYFNRQASNRSGKLEFITHKFVRYLMNRYGYAGSKGESLRSFICRKFGESAWNLLKRLM
nr:MAG TPA: hypothetical protein [Caudoviricetes sp.]